MADDVTIDLGMDPAGYLAGVQQITGANSSLQQSFGQTALTTVALQRGLDQVTPKRATLLAWGGMASMAAATENSYSRLNAQATVTNVSTARLTAGMRQLGREFPVGAQGAKAVVEQVSQMGVASAGSERRVLDLSKSVVKLSGATGEGPTNLAAGMIDLARATGNTNLDPRRFEKLGDSLTTVSAQSGAGAGNILAFSKNIAPMAQAAGIGATGVLGISSAFARLGEDGVGASTAVNKMLTDMSRSVREGSPEMASYAQIVGKTNDEFEKMFKNNPAEALTQVTEAIAKAGKDGPRMLESLGLDGTRSMRALTALSASGGLRPAIESATNAYGSGSTDKASQAAFGGLLDSVTELRTSAQQLAEAFGAPLLGPLAAFTNMLKTPVNLGRSVVESAPVQGLLKALAVGGVGIMATRAIMGPLTALGFARQAATSGPLRGLAAGIAEGRGVTATSGSRSTFMSRYGAAMTQADAEGRLGPINTRLMRFGQGIGEGLGPMGPPARFSMGERGRMGLGALATAAQMNMRMIGGSFYNASQSDPTRRVPVTMGAGEMWRGFGGQLKGIWSGPHDGVSQQLPTQGLLATMRMRAQGGDPAAARARFGLGADLGLANAPKIPGSGLAGVGNALGSFQERLLKAGEGANVFGRTSAAAAGMLASAGRFSLSSAASGAGMVAKGGKALLSGVGGPVGLALMGGLGLISAVKAHNANENDFTNQLKNADVSGTINSYRESIGKATDPTVTFGSQTDVLGRNIAAATTSMSQAGDVTASDIAVAAGSQGKVTHQFQGTAAQVAAQVRQVSPSGMSPDEMQAVKVDLLRQHPNDPDFVRKVLAQAIPASDASKKTAVETGSGGDDLASAVAAAGKSAQKGGVVGFLEATKLQDSTIKGENATHVGPAWMNNALSLFNTGGALHMNTLTDETKGNIRTAAEANAKRFSDQSTAYGSDYAQQERVKGANSMLEAAKKTGNADVFDEVYKTMAKNMLGHDPSKTMTAKDFEASGGDIAKFLASTDKDYAKGYKTLQDKEKAAGGEIKPNELQSAVSKNLAGVSPMMSAFFDGRKNNAATQAVQASLSAPGDLGALDKAASAMVNAAQKAGTSMADLGSSARDAANNLSETSQEFAIVKAAQAKAELVTAHAQVNMTPTQVAVQQYADTVSKATQDAKNPTQMAEKKQAQEALPGLEQNNRQRLVARLEEQRNYEKQVTRTTADASLQRKYQIEDYNKQVDRANRNFHTQQVRAEQDYGTQVARATEDYNTQREHAIRDFNISMARAQEDYDKTRSRAIRDFNISAQRAEADYLTSRSRQVRDFNVSLKRQIEDSAKSMLNPYDRLQTQVTWDAQNLLVNLKEQNDALDEQMKNMDKLRKQGLSQQAIDQLDLMNPANAQQAAQLTQDLANDPKAAAALNAEAARREADAKKRTEDPSDVSSKRAREDLNRGLKDQETDYRKSVKRSRDDFKKQLGDMSADMRTNIKRAHEDLTKGLKDQGDAFKRAMDRGADDYKKSVDRSTQDLNTALGDMEVDEQNSLTRQRTALNTALTRMATDIADADKIIGGDMKTLATAVGKAMHGQMGTYTKLLTNDANDFVTAVTTKIIPQMQAAAKDLGIDLPKVNSSGGAPHVAGRSSQNDRAYSKAEGGPIPGWSPHPKADNVPIWATAGEFMQPVDVVNHYGVDTMEKLRKKQIPKEVIEGFAEGGLIGFGHKLQSLGFNVAEHPKFGGVHPVHARGSQHYNKRGPGGGGAIDVNYDGHSESEDHAINRVVGLARQFGLRTIWHYPGHFNHAHFDIAGGSDLGNFKGMTSGRGGGIGSGSYSGTGLGGIDVDKLMKNLDSTRKGWYGKLRDELGAALHATYDGMAGGKIPGGDLGAHSANARANQAIARRLLSGYGFSAGQMPSLIKLWNGESGWNQFADNPSSDAYGIPQSLPGSKMASAGSDWRTNPETQIKWGLQYIKQAYGSPDRALQKWDARSPHWYGNGGIFDKGAQVIGVGEKGPEAVIPLDSRGVAMLAKAFGQHLGAEDGRKLVASNGSHMTVNHHEQITYDQRNDFGDAKITVMSNDPDDMARKLEARKVRSRLTQTRGVNRR